MCGSCKLYLKLNFLGLTSLARKFCPNFVNERCVTDDSSNNSSASSASSDNSDVIDIGNRVVTINNNSCVVSLSRLYLAAINSLRIHLFTISGSSTALLKDCSYSSPDLTNYNWLTDVLTADSFEAHSLSTTERLKVTLNCGLPTAVVYHYFDDTINFQLCDLQLHGPITIAISCHCSGATAPTAPTAPTATARLQQRIQGVYDHGLRSGHWLFESGSHSIICHYQDDKKHGLSVSHHHYINRRTIENWSCGQLHGQQLIYNNGKLTAVNFYKHDRLLRG